MSVMRSHSEGVAVEEMAPGAVETLLDREAREVLNLSGAEFAEKWAAGGFKDCDDPRVTDLAMLLP